MDNLMMKKPDWKKVYEFLLLEDVLHCLLGQERECWPNVPLQEKFHRRI